jgi:hypothetical protein
MKSKFLFGDIVVVEETLIGVIVKSWHNIKRGYHYDVYVREYNEIKEYDEDKIERYRIRHKVLNDEEIQFQKI